MDDYYVVSREVIAELVEVMRPGRFFHSAWMRITIARIRRSGLCSKKILDGRPVLCKLLCFKKLHSSGLQVKPVKSGTSGAARSQPPLVYSISIVGESRATTRTSRVSKRHAGRFPSVSRCAGNSCLAQPRSYERWGDRSIRPSAIHSASIK